MIAISYGIILIIARYDIYETTMLKNRILILATILILNGVIALFASSLASDVVIPSEMAVLFMRASAASIALGFGLLIAKMFSRNN